MNAALAWLGRVRIAVVFAKAAAGAPAPFSPYRNQPRARTPRRTSPPTPRPGRPRQLANVRGLPAIVPNGASPPPAQPAQRPVHRRQSPSHCGGGAPAGSGLFRLRRSMPGWGFLSSPACSFWMASFGVHGRPDSAPAPDFCTSAGHCTVSQPTPRATAAPLTRSHHFIPCALPRCALHLMHDALHMMPYALHLTPYT